MEITSHEDLALLLLILQELGEDGCEAIGLLPMPSLRHSGYSAAPENSLSFASTGGDGVHFNFLRQADQPPISWPVVMTVPMSFDRPNLVVGSDLRDFLALGIRIGYFELEQLVYRKADTIALLEQISTSPKLFSEKVKALAKIEQTFHINPWHNHEKRLAMLQNTVKLD